MMRRTHHSVIARPLLLALSLLGIAASSLDAEPSSTSKLDIALFEAEPCLEDVRSRIGDADVVDLAGVDNDPKRFGDVLRAVKVLHASLGFEVLVIPTGIFEAHCIERKSREGIAPEHAAITLPRQWRNNADVQRILAYARSTHGSDRELLLAGHLSRFGPAAKSLYPGLLFRYADRVGPDLLPVELRTAVHEVIGTREDLAKVSAARRAAVRGVALNLILALDAREQILREHYPEERVKLERQFLVNLLGYLDLEDLRAVGEVPAGRMPYGTNKNLTWFTNDYYKGKKLIVWLGQGEARRAAGEPHP